MMPRSLDCDVGSSQQHSLGVWEDRLLKSSYYYPCCMGGGLSVGIACASCVRPNGIIRIEGGLLRTFLALTDETVRPRSRLRIIRVSAARYGDCDREIGLAMGNESEACAKPLPNAGSGAAAAYDFVSSQSQLHHLNLGLSGRFLLAT